MATIELPDVLRAPSSTTPIIEVSGETIFECLQDLESKQPGLFSKIMNDKFQIKRFVLIFADGEDIRYQKALETKVKPSSTIKILVASAGG